jgi:hypothetical protein
MGEEFEVSSVQFQARDGRLGDRRRKKRFGLLLAGTFLRKVPYA